MHHLIRAAVLVALVGTPLFAVNPMPTAACVSAPAPFDSFTATVPNSGTIVVGTVEGLTERELQTRFRLKIDEVLRGDAPAVMRFSGLSGSDARSACGDKNMVSAREGDRLALAMSAAVPGQPLEVDAIAFVGKSMPDRRHMPKIERLPLRKVRQLAGRQPDGSTSWHPYEAGIAADNLIIKRVAPGVARVSARGTKHDLDAVHHLDVSPDDRVWAATRDAAFQLGQRREYRVGPGLPWAIGQITARPAGWVLTTASGVWRFEEDRGWKRLSEEAGRNDLWWPMMTTDGAVWALSMRGPSRLDGDGWTRFGWDIANPPAECLDSVHPLEQSDCTLTHLAEAPDGSVWLGFHTRPWESRIGGGLSRFDGKAWIDAPDPLDGEPFAVTHLTSYPGGPVWAMLVPRRADKPLAGAYGRAQLARWDGQAWTRSDLPTDLQAGRRSQPRELVAGPDGTVWLSRPLASFDGETWRRYDTPSRSSSKKPRVRDLSIAPDGSAWMVVRDTVKWKTTRPDGIYILDPERAKPIVEHQP